MTKEEIDISDINPCDWSGIACLRQRCEAQAQAEGLAGVELFFRGQQLFMKSLNRFPSYRERQKLRGAPVRVTASADELRRALEQIRDGHNNPRELAAQVLEILR